MTFLPAVARPIVGSPPLGSPNTASVASPEARPPGAASSSYSIGPSFDCGTKAVSEQPLAQMICASRELAYRELSYVIAYQALKEASSSDQRKTMVAEANALVIAINDRCNLPTTGALRRPPTEQEVGCIGALFQQERAALIERTTGVARDEAVLESGRYLRDSESTPGAGLSLPVGHRRRRLRAGHKEGYLRLATRQRDFAKPVSVQRLLSTNWRRSLPAARPLRQLRRLLRRPLHHPNRAIGRPP